MKQLFALVDCNNFYASCERVFQPNLRGRPIVVLSNNDGCIVARSEEAKALGIGMGVPVFKVRERLKREGVAVFSSNYALYGDMSRRVMDILREQYRDVEVYSIDEAFLALPAQKEEPLQREATSLRETIRQWTGLPVSIGIGPTKTLAKLANRLAKGKNCGKGAFTLTDPETIQAVLEKTPVTDIWGINKRLGSRLAAAGVKTAAEMAAMPYSWLRQNLTVTGLRLAMELKGTPCHELEVATEKRKNIACSRSFGRLVTKLEDLEEAVAYYASRAGEKLRSEESVAHHLQVFLHTNQYRPQDPQYSAEKTLLLPYPANDSPTLVKTALHGLRAIYRPKYNYIKAGVLLLNLAPADDPQQDFTKDSAATDRRQQLMQAMDQVNSKLGRNKLCVAATGIQRDWHMKLNKRSRLYTTDWADLPII